MAPTVPPTPFLPKAISSKRFADQSLLLATEIDFDDSFVSDGSPPVSHIRIPDSPSGSEGDKTLDLAEYLDRTPGCRPVVEESDAKRVEGSRGMEEIEEVEKWGNREEDDDLGRGNSTKRIGGDTPLKAHVVKKVRPPSPAKDDFYTRRLKDSDRRSSLGPKHIAITDEELRLSLARSVSRDSIGSSTSLRRSTSMTGKGKETERMGQDHVVMRDILDTPPSLPPPIISHQSTSSRASTASLARAISTADQYKDIMEDTAESSTSLRRTMSNVSDISTTSKISVTDKVTGFFRGLMKRASLDIQQEQPLPEEQPEKQDLEEGSRVEEENDEGTEETNNDHPGEPFFSQPERNLKMAVTGGPKLRLPPTLTRPAPRTLSTDIRALQPKRTINIPSLPPSIPPSKPSQLHSKSTNSHSNLNSKSTFNQKDHIQVRSKAPTSFTARALARLPQPGKGSTSSSQPTKILTTERANNLLAKRQQFESLSKVAAQQKTSALAKYSIPPKSSVNIGMKKTVPIRGNTPGKASRKRAEERERFELGLKERNEERMKMEEKLRKAREELEEEEEKVRRLERVVWAKPVPEMYWQGREK